MFDNAKHPRGNPKNKGEFASKGGAGGASAGSGDDHGERLQRLRRAMHRMTPEQKQRLKDALGKLKAKREGIKKAASPENGVDHVTGDIGDGWKTQLPHPDEVQKVPSSKPKRHAVAGAVRDRLGEIKTAMAEKQGVKSGAEVKLTSVQQEMEFAIFSTFEPLASGQKRNGPIMLGKLTDQEYAKTYQYALTALKKYRDTI
jgi:hypothetical protein